MVGTGNFHVRFYLTWSYVNLDDPHFTEDCFEVDSAFASQFGMKKRRRLRLQQYSTNHPQPRYALARLRRDHRAKGLLVLVVLLVMRDPPQK